MEFDPGSRMWAYRTSRLRIISCSRSSSPFVISILDVPIAGVLSMLALAAAMALAGTALLYVLSRAAGRRHAPSPRDEAPPANTPAEEAPATMTRGERAGVRWHAVNQLDRALEDLLERVLRHPDRLHTLDIAGEVAPLIDGRLNVAVRQNGRWLRVEIRDFGPRAGRALIPNLPGPLRLDRSFPGDDLSALDLAKRLADLAGGQLEITSASGKGRTFVAKIPID